MTIHDQDVIDGDLLTDEGAWLSRNIAKAHRVIGPQLPIAKAIRSSA